MDILVVSAAIDAGATVLLPCPTHAQQTTYGRAAVSTVGRCPADTPAAVFVFNTGNYLSNQYYASALRDLVLSFQLCG